ncbi:MAG: DUF4012 domain-containing protein [Candidatus Gottesmanbacteria bacterium]|nr:DUF4012 domain-containing protein [Candidatus Gottesmanbacteria bacterium]
MLPEELKKIDLQTTPIAPVAEPPMKPKKSFPWKIIGIPLGILLLVLAIIGIMLLPLRGVIVKAQAVVAAGRETGAAIKKQDLVKTKEGLATTRSSLTALRNEYNKVLALKVLPFFGAYISDGDHAIKAGFAGLDAGDAAITALEPNADLLGLKGKSNFVSGTADDRIQTAVKTMNALVPKINAMAASVDTLRREINYIDPNRYPDHIGKTSIRPQLVGAKEVIENAANLFVNAQPLLTNLPNILGYPIEKRYLVIFQNDKELRPTGGFMTAYAQFRFVGGKAILEKSDDIYALDAALNKKYPAQPEILTYLPGVYNLNIRDSNLSPDFKLSMQRFSDMYANTAGHEHIDGIWTMDTHVLVEILKILGPIRASGRVFSAEIDKRCNCAGAIYELEDYSSRPVNYVRTDRKGEIGELMRAMLQMALGVSPSKYWGNLFQMLITEISDKHIQAYFTDITVQKAAESFNMAGRIATASESASVLKYQEGKGWDYLHINEANMGGAKANMFVTEKITKDTTVNTDGTMTTKLTIDYKNPYPGSDCGLESGGLCLNAQLRNWIRVYVPAGSTLKESRGTQSPKDGKAVPMSTSESLGKTVFEGFVTVNPLGVAQLTATYTSPVKTTDGKYRLLIQRQSGSSDQNIILKLNGREKVNTTLLSDTEFTL